MLNIAWAEQPLRYKQLLTFFVWKIQDNVNVTLIIETFFSNYRSDFLIQMAYFLIVFFFNGFAVLVSYPTIQFRKQPLINQWMWRQKLTSFFLFLWTIKLRLRFRWFFSHYYIEFRKLNLKQSYRATRKLSIHCRIRMTFDLSKISHWIITYL